jgi:hypothetical protein
MPDVQKWQNYEFTVVSINSNWNDVGGVYVFASKRQDAPWKAIYVGQTKSFKADMLPTFPKWIEAERLGATSVHAMSLMQDAARTTIEKGLIQSLDPPLNKVG